MRLPLLMEKTEAGIYARKFALTLYKLLYPNKPGYMLLADPLTKYWYEQIDKYGWRRLSKARMHELNERTNIEKC